MGKSIVKANKIKKPYMERIDIVKIGWYSRDTLRESEKLRQFAQKVFC